MPKSQIYTYPTKSKKPHGLKGRPRPQEVRDAISQALKGRPRPGPCYLTGKKGPDHPCYKHGQSAVNRVYEHEKHAAWIQGVKRQSQYRCFITGAADNLHCHHFIGWQQEKTRYEIVNGIAIHKSVHTAFHNEYGRGGNTPEQFEEFCRKHYNITEYPWRQGNHKPRFTILEEKYLSQSLMEKKAKEFVDLVSVRCHQIVEGSYKTNSSVFLLHCAAHDQDHVVRAGRYKAARFGIPCCSSAKQSLTATKTNKRRALCATQVKQDNKNSDRSA